MTDALSQYLFKTADTDFIVGEDSFDDLTINEAPEKSEFYYFVNSSKTLVRRFVLKRTKLSEKICVVTLIKNVKAKFEPRFEFRINDLSKKAVESLALPIIASEQRLIKARVNLDDCHKQFSEILAFLRTCDDIELPAKKYAVVTADQKKQLDEAIENSGKDQALLAISEKFGNQITEKDITLIAKRRNALDRFKKILTEPGYFKKYTDWLSKQGKSSRPEDVWQHFFEENTWIFGYGLQLVACESLDDKKLETTVVGSDIFDGGGKRIDGLLKTKGSISRSIFAEIKQHTANLVEKYNRPSVFVPGKDLQGAVSQVQKTIHKVNLKVNQNLTAIKDKDGNPSGEEIAFIRPKGLVVIGTLNQLSVENGINDEMFASFELYRQQISGIEILTYDELYERTKYIVGDD